ncbi:MAG: MBL fold metallo-hydrolase, partial [Pseudomonadota bacterium]
DAGQLQDLGYLMDGPGLRVVHPGDTVPLAALDEALHATAPDLLLAPVNGRDAARRADGVPGNMTLDEAIAFGRRISARALVPHHWGMFDFNTIPPETIDRATAPIPIHRPVPGERTAWTV